jgi:hypothetical protein
MVTVEKTRCVDKPSPTAQGGAVVDQPRTQLRWAVKKITETFLSISGPA